MHLVWKKIEIILIVLQGNILNFFVVVIFKFA